MQNFTLGKKGYSLLLFLLVLLIGSSPTFGQTNCPTSGGTPSNQTFCYLQTVGDINTDGNAIYSTADSTNDTQAIPDSELLANDVYYAGNNSSTCTTRVAITVTVNNAPYPNNTLFPGENSFTISNCSGSFTAEQLATYFTPIADYQIRVYSEEFGNTIATGPLVNNESYFVGQVSPSQNNTTASSCPSLRVAVGYEQRLTPPPTATSPQTFCNGATVADLEAQGTSPNTQAIRWYRTATSPQPLPDSTVLIDGQTYYATQIINNRNDAFPPCESDTRTPVQVVVQARSTVESTQSFCASVGTGNDFRMPQVQDLVPQGGTFFATEDSNTPLDSNTELIDGEDYFNRDNTADCSQNRITVEFFDTPNAGSTTFTSACTNDDSFDLVSRINPSQLGAPQTTGFFTPALASGTNIFTPQDYPAGSYTFTYTIEGNANCPTDTSVITVEVQQAPNAGPDQTITFCQSEIETLVNLAISDPAAAQAILTQRISNADLTGSFTNADLQNIALGYVQAVNNNDFPFNAAAVYTVDNGNCQDSSNIQVVVNESPNAGNDSSVTLSTQQDPVNLYSYITGNPDANGTFAPGNANGDLDPANYTVGTYTFTYTVTSTNGCSDSSELTVTITDQIICPEVADNTQEFCESISDVNGNNPRRPQVRDLMPMNTVWYATADSQDPLDPNQVLVNNEDYFAGNANGTCPNRERVVVQIDAAPNAGATTNITACRTEAPFDIVARLNPSILGAADAGGTITPAFASGTTVFNPSVDAEGQYTYTVRSTNGACEDDSTIINITITEPVPANAGPDVNLIFCSTAGVQNLFDSLPIDLRGGSFAGLTNGLFDPAAANIGNNTVVYTLDSNDGCFTGSDDAAFTINVIQGPNAGNDSSVTLSTQQEPVNLFSYITGNPDANGTFAPGNANGDLDPANYTVGTYTFTYTVTSTNGCSDSSELTVTITDQIICPVIADTTQEFCESISDVNGNNPRRPQVRDLMPMNIVWYATATSQDALDPTQTLVDNEDYFAGNANGDCPNRERVVVQIDAAPNAGATTNITACRTESPFDIVARLNPSILGAADAGGIISPALASGTTVFNPAVDTAGQYTYTVQSENGACTDDSTIVNITITEPVPANAGPDVDLTFCSTAGIQNLFESLPADSRGGSFAGLTNGLFDPATANIGNNTVVYTLDSDDGCFTGSDDVTFTINVIQGPNAGNDSSVTLSTQQDPVNLFSYITGNPDANGNFSPGNANGDLDPANYTVGDYTFTYTVTSTNGCSDESQIVLTISDVIVCPEVVDTTQEFCETVSDANGNNPRKPQVRDLMPMSAIWYASATSQEALDPTQTLVDNEDYFAGNANANCPSRGRVLVIIDDSPNAGATTNLVICSDEIAFDLVERINASILGAADTGGIISPALASGTTVFNPAVDGEGQYIYTVESQNGKCEDDTTIINISIVTPMDANAGTIENQSLCSLDEVLTLSDLITDSDITLGGTFSGTGVENGLFDPSIAGEGTFTITYNVSGNDIPCLNGNATSDFTITVTNPADAPTADENQSFCLIDNPTVGDITVTGDNVVFYTDADLTNVADVTTALVSGNSYYAASTNDSGACASDAVMITVTITDPSAPTLQLDGNEFCRADNPTVQDLIGNLNGSGIQVYSTISGGTAITATTPLQNDVTYYATTTATGGCESSERLAIAVEVTFCGIPEGFSPNGDGINDQFVIPDVATVYPNYTIEIFNRWGNVVFKGNSSTPDWDGTSNQSGTLGNDVLPVGVYFYILNYNDGQTSPVQGKLYLSI